MARGPAAKQNQEQKRNPALEENRDHNFEVEIVDKDDEWYDTTTSEDVSPVKRKRHADFESSVVTVKPPTPEEEVALLPYMPTLFGADPPPCSAEVQVAYEIVNQRLRQRWLNHRGRLSAVDICQAVQSDIRDQNRLWPPGSVKGTFKRRKPWCRENVFRYQLRWIDYFVREANAQAHADPELMTESEIMDRRKHCAVPKELKFTIERREVLALWDEWNDKKRARTPVLPGVETGSGLGAPLPDGTVEVYVSGDAKEVQSLVNPSEETVTPNPTVEAGYDAHVWSEGCHD